MQTEKELEYRRPEEKGHGLKRATGILVVAMILTGFACALAGAVVTDKEINFWLGVSCAVLLGGGCGWVIIKAWVNRFRQVFKRGAKTEEEDNAA